MPWTAGIDVKDITFISGNGLQDKGSLEMVYDGVMLPSSLKNLKGTRAFLCEKLFTPSTAIRIRFPENVWWNHIPGGIYMWYRTLRQSR